MGILQNIQRTLILLMLISLSMLNNCRIYGTKEETANFVFGDSILDVGNNNYLSTLLKANTVPYGIDYVGPTGRFTNGQTIVDLIAQILGKIGHSSAYLDPTTKGNVILKGVNYASGGAGILNETGSVFIGRINLDAQLDNFANTKQDIMGRIGEPATTELLNKAFFPVIIGSNDYIANYLLPGIIKGHHTPTPEVFADTLISKFTQQLTRLYNMGARKILVTNIGQIGCAPAERKLNQASGNQCAAKPNEVSQLYNIRLKTLLTELNSNLTGSKFLYADVNSIFKDLIYNYRSYGFENIDSPCCHDDAFAGNLKDVIPCNLLSSVCSDRSMYAYWDVVHPTEATNLFVTKRIVDGNITDISPINVRQLLCS